MTRPTPAALAFARSTLPVRRVASSGTAPGFAALLKAATLNQPKRSSTQARVASSKATEIYHAAMLPAGVGSAPISRSEIINTAQQLMDVPYVWGGTSSSGLDCSAFVSKAWGVPRHTTDTLSSVA